MAIFGGGKAGSRAAILVGAVVVVGLIALAYTADDTTPDAPAKADSMQSDVAAEQSDGEAGDGAAEEGAAEEADTAAEATPIADPGRFGTLSNDLAEPGVFFEDFTTGESLSRFTVGVYHRNDSGGMRLEWVGDHPPTGPDDLCGPPTEQRVVNRGERSEGFNHEWVYRCVPGGDLEKAHLMTSIGATSGYSIGAFTPNETFQDVREIRWDVNQTDLGARQWTEVTLIPADRFAFNELPCLTGLPCGHKLTPAEVGSVGTHWAGTRVRFIGTPEQPNGYRQSSGPRGYRCKDCSREPAMRFGEAYGAGDPALTSIAIRRENYFRDNGDGTLTWGFQLDDGSFNDFTAPGTFPKGPVRVVFKDHNYTPLKSPSKLLPETTFTWHWDNIKIEHGELES